MPTSLGSARIPCSHQQDFETADARTIDSGACSLVTAANRGKESITEGDLRTVLRETRWDHHRVLFEKLVRRAG
jgi:hypothetical protein